MLEGRRVLRLDGLFELLLASLVLLPAASGADMRAAFGVSEWLVIAIGIALVPVGVVLLVVKPERPTLLALGAINAVGAVLFALYVPLRASEMNAYGIMVLVLAAAGLVALAVAEIRLAAGSHGRTLVG